MEKISSRLQPAMQLFVSSVILLWGTGCVADSNWLDEQWEYRLPVEVHAAGYERYEKPVEMELDIDQLAGEEPFGFSGLQIVEVDANGRIVNANVPFQFEHELEPGGGTNKAHGLVFLMQGQTPPDAVRYFHVYFGNHTEAISRPASEIQINVTDNVPYQGQDAVQIETPGATYFYHKEGGGFAGMFDRDGHDWITYRPEGGSAGNYRGIPNMVYPAGHFHPNSRTSTTTILSEGPIRARLYSETENGDWASIWSIYPNYAVMTLLRGDGPYWFLYEGTPGGELDVENDFVVRSTGEKNPVSESWAEKIPEPRWAYFGAGNVDRSLFVVHHQDDGETDQFWQMQENMTVFGFGREYTCCDSYLTDVPAQFTVGLVESQEFEEMSRTIDSAFREPQISVGSLESRDTL